MGSVTKRSPPESKKLTPMMRQYLGVKETHPGSLVLFRMGDFFETFFDDAVECARILDITLTARSKEKDIPMAGVPHHALDAYLARLIEAGRTVVIVDQVENPKQAKGLVRREVTRVVSPGTFVDPQASPRKAHHLVAVYFAPKATRKKSAVGFGIGSLDVSTGAFRATSGTQGTVLADELSRLMPKELLVLESQREDPRFLALTDALEGVAVTPVSEPKYGGEASKSALVRAFGAEEVAGLRQVLPGPALTAAGVALQFVEDTQILPGASDVVGEPSLKHIRSLEPYEPGRGLVLDAQAVDHLELFSSRGQGGPKGSLLYALDAAVTSMGGRKLAEWLAYPLQELEPIAARQDAIACLVSSPSHADQIRTRLAGVGDLFRLTAKAVLGRANPRDLVALGASLAQAPGLLAKVRACVPEPNAPRSSLMGQEAHRGCSSTRLVQLSETDPLTELKDKIVRALVDEPSVDLSQGQVFREGHDEVLDRLSEVAQNGKSMIAQLLSKERERTGISSLRIRYNRVFGYYIEVTKANLHLVPDDYVRKQTTVNSERFFTPELKELETEVLTAEEKRVERTIVLFEQLVMLVSKEADRLKALAETLSEVDVLVCLAHIAEQRSWVRPAMDDEGFVEIVEGRHPVLERLSSELGERFVPNDLTISAEERLVIVTGPNMAGKSTIMRQTALIAVLAHMGSYVPAQSARIGLIDRIFTRVGASDELSKGRSTFMVEMNETARILRSATARSLILLDEIGRGTSTFDGLSIAWAVAEHLHDRVGAKTLFATHYHELTEICRNKAHAVNRHVAVKEWDDSIVFLRKLMPGATNRSYGVQVARLAGLPERVVARAREVLNALEDKALSGGDQGPVGSAGSADEVEDRTQLHLFSVKKKEAHPGSDAFSRVASALAALSMDDLTPRQAHAKLVELQAMLGSD